MKTIKELPKEVQEKLQDLVINESSSWNSEQSLTVGFEAGYEAAMQYVVKTVAEIERPIPSCISWGVASKSLKDKLGVK